MVSLAVDFAGLRLKSPIVAASAPPTETLKNIVECAKFGAGAVVTKTSADFDPDQFILGGRRTYANESGLWAQSTFRRETLTIEQGARLVSQAVKEVDIPIIASVGSLSLDPDNYLNCCRAMEESGASMIQLALFYVPQPRCTPEHIMQLTTLLKHLADNLNIPIDPKLNIDFPAYYAA